MLGSGYKKEMDGEHLRLISGFFRNYFTQNFMDSESKLFPLEDVSIDVWLSFEHFISSGGQQITPDNPVYA